MTRNETLPQFYGLITYLAEGYYHKASPGLKRVMDVDDLFEEGVIGAIMAIDSYERDKGRLTPWVKLKANGHIVDSIRRVYPIPQERWKQIEGLRKAEEKLMHKLGREATDKELAAYMKVPFEKIEEIRSWIIVHVDLERSPIIDEQQKPDEVYNFKQLRGFIDKWMGSHLTALEAFVWVERINDGRTLREIAEKLKCANSTVSKIEATAKAKLRTYLRKKGWQDEDLPDIKKKKPQQHEDLPDIVA